MLVSLLITHTIYEINYAIQIKILQIGHSNLIESRRQHIVLFYIHAYTAKF